MAKGRIKDKAKTGFIIINVMIIKVGLKKKKKSRLKNEIYRRGGLTVKALECFPRVCLSFILEVAYTTEL